MSTKPGNGPLAEAWRRVWVWSLLTRWPFVGALLTAALPVVWIVLAHGKAEYEQGRTIVTVWEALSYDLPFLLRGRGRPQADAWLVEIRAESFTPRTDADHDKRIDRGVLAEALGQLARLRPRLVVLDLLLSDLRDEEQARRENARLMDQLRQIASDIPVVLATAVADQTHPDFRAAGVHFGLADVDAQPWNTVRQLPGLFSRDAEPSLAWVAATHLGASVTRTGAPGEARWLNYYGPSRDVFERIELNQFLAAEPHRLEPFKGRVVFVGLTPPMDRFQSPIRWETIGGVEVQATAVLNLQHQDWLRVLPVRWQVVGLLLYAGGVAMVLGGSRSRRGIFLCWGATCVAIPGIAWICQVHLGVWAWWVIPILQAPVAIAAGSVAGRHLVFISYRSSDGEEAAFALEQGLLARRLRAYLAPGQIEPGTSFPRQLRRRIRRAPLFLLVLSPDARRTLTADQGWVATEVRQAMLKGRRIVIVRPILHVADSENPAITRCEAAPPLDPAELPADLQDLAGLQSVVLETGLHRQAALDAICRSLW